MHGIIHTVYPALTFEASAMTSFNPKPLHMLKSPFLEGF
jgi:hypothetical protein